MIRLLLSCDGARPAGSTEPCRGWWTAPAERSLEKFHARANAAGWAQAADGTHRCPSCVRALTAGAGSE